MNPRLFPTLLISLISLSSFSLTLLAERSVAPFDHSTWDQFLKKFVNEEGEVNFQAAKQDHELLKKYEIQIGSIKDFDEWPREEILAFWINVYHAGVMRAILDHYPLKNIQEIPGIWENSFIQAGKHESNNEIVRDYYSLNQIRNGQLMTSYRDEKIHTALWFAAKDSPRLRREAYVGPRVEGQLYLATQDFVNGERYNHIVPGEKKIQLSPLFKWHAQDFILDFAQLENDRDLSRSEHAVLSFIAHYLQDPEKIRYLEEGSYKIKYRIFDWSLSEWQKNPSTASALPASK